MPRIPSYPLIGSLSNNDLLVIDDVSQQYATKSVELQSLKGYFNTGQATTTYVDDKVVSGAGFNTNTGVLTLTRTDGVDVTQSLDNRYYLSNNPNNYTSNLGVVQSLTTNNSSGAATLVSGVLNIPQYSSGGSGGVTEITTTAPITGGTITGEGTIGITQASASTNGYLSSTDWNTFNNKSSFDGQYSSLTGKPTLATVATSGSYNDLSDKPTIPPAYANSDVDAHLNTSTASNNEVLSWTGSDYGWVAQSGGGGGGVTSIIAGDGISIDPAGGTGDVTITAGTAQASTWQTFYRKFTGTELRDAFAGSPSNEILLVNGAPNKVIVLGVEATTFLNFNTGTTDYADNTQSLAIYPDTASGFQFPTSINIGAIGSIGSANPFGIRFKNTTTSYTQPAPTGAAIVLGSYGAAVSITAGDRDFIITFPYRIIDLS